MKPRRTVHELWAAFAGRLFFALSLAAAAAGSLRAQAPGEPGGWMLRGEPGSLEVSALECASGRVLAARRMPAPLTAPAALASDGRSGYVASADRRLTRLDLPALEPAASVELPLEAAVLAVAAGPDAIVLAGGHGAEPLSAHDARTLAPLQRYPVEPGATVTALLDLPARRRMLVGFGDLPQLWEIAYDRDAPPVLRGLVHDYRSREWVALPGRLTPRAFEVATPTRALVPGGEPFEVARVDAAGVLGVVNLDVRREIERPALPAVASGRVAGWRDARGRGWVAADAGGPVLAVLHAPAWRVARGPALAAPAVAVATVRGTAGVRRPDAEVVVSLHANGSSWTLSTIDAASGTARPVGELRRADSADDANPRLAPSADRGCVAVLDADGRWLGAWIAGRDAFVAGPR